MPRAKLIFDFGIIARAVIDILDHQRQGRAGGLALEHTGQDAHLIGFLALSDEPALARAALIEIGLDIGFRQGQARRHAVEGPNERTWSELDRHFREEAAREVRR